MPGEILIPALVNPPDDAVFDGKVPARVEKDAVCSGAMSLDGEAAQMSAVARAGIARGTPDGRGAVVDDADRLGDGSRNSQVCTEVRRDPRATHRDSGVSPCLPFPGAGRGCALGRFRRPCAEHRMHDLANIGGKNCFAENQESLELLEISNS